MIDAIDEKIVMMLQENARVSNTEIARQVGMAPSATLERLRKLEASGIIDGYRAQVNPKLVGLGLLAFIFIRGSEPAGAVMIGTGLAEFPEVQEVHHVAGEDCYLVKARAASTEELGRLLRRFGGIPGVISTRTTIVLDTLKETTALPMPERAGD